MSLKSAIKMPPVKHCEVMECCYNTEGQCHARAITVGDSERALCDTFFQCSSSHTQEKVTAGVGACKVSVCEYNKSYECSAKGIEVGRGSSSAECLTFERR